VTFLTWFEIKSNGNNDIYTETDTDGMKLSQENHGKNPQKTNKKTNKVIKQ
jgi:hypothetical protein